MFNRKNVKKEENASFDKSRNAGRSSAKNEKNGQKQYEKNNKQDTIEKIEKKEAAEQAARVTAAAHHRTGHRRPAGNPHRDDAAGRAQTSAAPLKNNAGNGAGTTPEKAPAKGNAPAPGKKKNASEPFEKTNRPLGKLRIIPLGGLNEIGKNMTAIEYENDIIVVDCGMGFPDEEMPGVDLVIPDVSYLEANLKKVRGIFLTHGHEDHIGAIPYVLRTVNPPVYGTRLTLGIIRKKLEEFKLPFAPKLNTVNAGDTVRAGALSVEFIRVNHSIADACCLAIHTPLGTVVHTGDFKLDLTPIEGEMTNLTRLGELGAEGVLLLMCESTNAERPGYTPSEKKVGESLEYIFSAHADKRIVIATFSSNVHRVQQIIDVSARHHRHVAISGRSMETTISAAVELGYMHVPKGTLIDLAEIKRFKPEELTLITTGSQGEPMSALYRMAFSDHNQITLGYGDLVVLSASAIPGNEKTIGRVINELTKNGVRVLNDAVTEVHVSGHACQEELKLIQALTKPRYFMPVHGEFRHLYANADLARSLGMPEERIFISDIGKVLEIDENGARWGGTVPAGKVLIDGLGVGDVGSIVLRDRLHLSQDGLFVVVATMDSEGKTLLSGPEIISRGFVYVRESEALMEDARRVAQAVFDKALDSSRRVDRVQLKNALRDEMTRFLSSRTGRKPMVLPIIMNV